MDTMTNEEFIKDYVKKAIDRWGYGSANFSYRWCVARQKTVAFAALVDLKCWDCKSYMMNGGICDPL